MRNLAITLIVIGMMTSSSFGNTIKEPNVSGQFYTDDPSRLSAQIDAFFQSAAIEPSDKKIEILISPHAGYMYSGGVAAYGFKAASRASYKTVIILAPSHFQRFDGVSVWKEGGFQTPLGVVPVDETFAQQLTDLHPKFIFEPQVFDREHSLEVQLPFLQKTFKDFRIVPVILGQLSYELCEELATRLNEVIGNREDVLVVASSDMSHYHDDAFARKMDQRTIKTITEFQAKTFWQQCRVQTMEMCGFIPVTTALLLARKRQLSGVDVLKYSHSGDITGDNDRVVGYTSIMFYKVAKKAEESKNASMNKPAPDGQLPSLNLQQKKRLMDIAKQTIDKYVRTGQVLDFKEKDARLSAAEGVFVTIHKSGKLRGCIGNIITRQPLIRTVRDMAVAASSKDPRFTPVTEGELAQIDVEISVLSKPRTVTNVEEIEVGVHGVIVRRGPGHQGVFLPQVATEWGWNREEFLSNLCSHKAGLPPDAWKDPKTHIEIFTADVFSEKDVE